MKNSRVNWTFIVGFVIVGTLVAILFPKEAKRNENATIRIGAGDDVSGLLMNEVAELLQGEYAINQNIEASSFQDCCSNTAQWALNAKEINLGFYCTHIAKHTIEQNEDVEIYGPVIMNGEVIAYKGDWEDVSVVGVTQGRKRSQELASATYPQIQEYNEISQKGLLYAVEDEQVDAAILDITKATGISGYKYKPLSREDYVSYVLVVDKEFRQTQAFADFIDRYNEAIRKLSDQQYLAERLGVEEKWLDNKPVKFLELGGQER